MTAAESATPSMRLLPRSSQPSPSCPSKSRPGDASFLSTLPEPLLSYAKCAVPAPSSSSLPTAALRIDELELSMRSHLLTLTGDLLRHCSGSLPVVTSGSGGGDEGENEEKQEEEQRQAMSNLLVYLRTSIDLCLHLILCSARPDEKEQDNNKKGGDDGEEISTLSSFPSIAYRGMGGAIVRKLPFVLLEDTIDTLPLQQVKRIWQNGFEQNHWIAILSNPATFFARESKLVLIRVCNKLLKKLSNRDRDAEFAGRVMMLLASVFPLSERSAVNVLGTFNVQNVTNYETELEFRENQFLKIRQQEEREEEEDRNEKQGADEAQDYQRGMKKTPASRSSNASGAYGNYTFYETFWSVQEVFTDPNILLPTIKDPSKMKKVDEFVKSVNTVLAAFEGHAFPEEVVKQSRARWLANRQLPVVQKVYQSEDGNQIESSSSLAANTSPKVADESKIQIQTPIRTKKKSSSSSSSSSVRHHKYLTNSQLLHLQLRDPEIRIHFLTQLLIITSYLTSSIGNFATNFPTVKDQCNEVIADLITARKRAEDLLRQTPPNGSSHLQTLEWLLEERESTWRRWKRNKCLPPLEKFRETETKTKPTKKKDMAPREEEEDEEEEDQTTMERAKKRRKLMDGPLSTPGAGDAVSSIKSAILSSDPYSYRMDMKKDLPAISRNMANTVPDLYNYLEEYVDALDPEAGIDEEYHPRNDKVFTWRALRLLSRQHLALFGDIRKSNGDFERIVRNIWKEERHVDIPGRITEQEEEEEEVGGGKELSVDDVKSEEDQGAESKDEQQQDGNKMDDDVQVSAGEEPMDEEGEKVKKEEDEEEDDEGTRSGSADDSFDDASVGSPVSGEEEGKEEESVDRIGTTKNQPVGDGNADSENKAAKQREFEKAAMEEEADMLEEKETSVVTEVKKDITTGLVEAKEQKKESSVEWKNERERSRSKSSSSRRNDAGGRRSERDHESSRDRSRSRGVESSSSHREDDHNKNAPSREESGRTVRGLSPSGMEIQTGGSADSSGGGTRDSDRNYHDVGSSSSSRRTGNNRDKRNYRRDRTGSGDHRGGGRRRGRESGRRHN